MRVVTLLDIVLFSFFSIFYLITLFSILSNFIEVGDYSYDGWLESADDSNDNVLIIIWKVFLVALMSPIVALLILLAYISRYLNSIIVYRPDKGFVWEKREK